MNTDAAAPPIAIVGGGPAGMALALALRRHGQAACIFDARERGAGFSDQRILALSEGSRQTLEWLGVWHDIPVTPIETIHVSQQGGLGRTRLLAKEEGVPALGYVLTAADLIRALDRAVAAAAIPWQALSRIDDVRADNSRVHFTVNSVEQTAALVAFAEGSVDPDAAATMRDYQQHAVICTVTAREPHGREAWERFTPEGPVALLPLPGNEGRDLAVVLTCTPNEAPELAQLDDAAFLARLQQRFGERRHLASVGPRAVYPLGLRARTRITDCRQVWLGNAAQTLHPVAGQGFNLALRDIRDLARTLEAMPDPGDASLLAAYARRRSLDRQGTIGFTDGLVRLFSNADPLLRHLRGAGLLALDLLPPIRSFVARRMMFGARRG